MASLDQPDTSDSHQRCTYSAPPAVRIDVENIQLTCRRITSSHANNSTATEPHKAHRRI